MKIPLIDLTAQYESIKSEIDTAISRVIADTAFVGGKYVHQFEEAFASYCRAKYCVGVGNGTDALYLTLRGLGIGRGDEVITAANSFIATSEAITMTGASVVFVDCDPVTYNMDVTKVGPAITERTKAIVPVHLYGQPAEMAALGELARRYNLFIIEDAAQAHGAEIDGQRVGTLGHAATFSFYPGKNLGAYGDAGAVVTNDERLAASIRLISNHGRTSKYDHEVEGVNSRLDGLQAAILQVKLKHLDEWNSKRRAVAEWYSERLTVGPIITPVVPPHVKPVYHLYVVRLPHHRDAVRERLQEVGIATGIHYPIPLPSLRAYHHLGWSPGDFPIASRYAREIMSLPMFPELKEQDVVLICKNLLEIQASLES